ncbi:MAG: Ig-like domain repeat protein, partial [Chloroflexi bacterium]|nr:Ig-like domain repeat protein [Chloroflexota bacterium]
ATANRIARLTADGTLDANFVTGSGTNDIVQAMTVQSDAKVIIGGSFTTYKGTAANRIARLHVEPPAAPAITSAASAAFTIGTAGGYTVTATGTPAPTLSMSGTLPSGITFNTATGVLSGAPAVGAGGSFGLSFTAANGVGANAVQPFTLIVNRVASAVSVSSSVNPTVSGQSVTFTATVTGSGGTPTGAVSFMDGATVLAAANLNGSGAATFTTGSLSASAHSITASYSGDGRFAGSVSSALTQTVQVGPVTKLALLFQIGGADVGKPFLTQPVVRTEDAFGNLVTTAVATVHLAITAGTGAPGALLGCDNLDLPVTNGVAAFANCSIDKAGTGYTLTASAGGFTSVVGLTFDVAR